MNGPNLTRSFARNAAESAYPNLWRGLVAAWAPPGAPRHATRLWDYSGNGNHGTLQNGASWAPGKHGHALNFDGTDDDVIGDTPGKNFPAGNQSRSVSCWIKSPNWTGDNGLLHWGKDGSSPAGANYHLVAGNGGKILWGNGYDHGIVYGNRQIADNLWHHLAVTYNSNEAIIYIDGVIDAVDYHSTATLLTDSWRIGRFQNGAGAWPGFMHSFYIYQRVLKLPEIALLTSGANPMSRKFIKKTVFKEPRQRIFCTIFG
jgi:hypothetical protein